MKLEDARKIYTSLDALHKDARFAPYGNNALPLFALCQYFSIEDIDDFATDSLTDHPDDKKADFIYINESDGLACVAQGYTSTNWGKTVAPANKASDLNTAAVWLLQAAINEVPETIRSHAKLLREGIQNKTINKVVFAYAHNALESVNVQKELRAVQDHLRSLPMMSGVEVETIELGLRQIEEFYLNSQGTIRITDTINIPSKQIIEEKSGEWKAYVVSLNGQILFDLYDKYKHLLFSANLRDFLGARKSSGNVNNNIRETVKNNPTNFFVLNNGITLITKKVSKKRRGNGLVIHGVSVVNGAQTTGAIHAAGRKSAGSVSVLARIIIASDPRLISTIVAGNNTQNSIVSWDRRSNDPVQIRLKSEFSKEGVEYIHRRDSSRKTATSIFNDKVGQMLCAFGGDLQTAIRAKADIFESDETYSKVFPTIISKEHVYAIQTLGWAYDLIKREFKAKSNAGSITKIEKDELSLLDYPASKQFIVCVVGSLIEEIAGISITDPGSFGIDEKFINPGGKEAIEAWASVLRSVLPVLATDLPAEPYQVVRSTEHTHTLSQRAKGVIAASPTTIQKEFEKLRKIICLR